MTYYYNHKLGLYYSVETQDIITKAEYMELVMSGADIKIDWANS